DYGSEDRDSGQDGRCEADDRDMSPRHHGMLLCTVGDHLAGGPSHPLTVEPVPALRSPAGDARATLTGRGCHAILHGPVRPVAPPVGRTTTLHRSPPAPRSAAVRAATPWAAAATGASDPPSQPTPSRRPGSRGAPAIWPAGPSARGGARPRRPSHAASARSPPPSPHSGARPSLPAAGAGSACSGR